VIAIARGTAKDGSIATPALEAVLYYKVDESLTTNADSQIVCKALNHRLQKQLSKMSEINVQQASRLSQIEEKLLYKNQASVTAN
jgi:cytoplasmic iron level regulating protein YaaA (DUF328/UPF0246 family)